MSAELRKLDKKMDVETTLLDSFAIGVATDKNEGRVDVIFQLGDDPQFYAMTLDAAQAFVQTMQSCIEHIKGDAPSAIH